MAKKTAEQYNAQIKFTGTFEIQLSGRTLADAASEAASVKPHHLLDGTYEIIDTVDTSAAKVMAIVRMDEGFS